MLLAKKSAQLQIRISSEEKAMIQLAAQQRGMDMSSYVLEKLLPKRSREFEILLNKLVITDEPRFVLSEINLFLSRLTTSDLSLALTVSLPAGLSDYYYNYIAAMVEFVCHQQQQESPTWTKQISPLKIPVFGSSLQSLRLYLLTHSPAAFRKRNIFIDTTVGGQV